MVALKDINAGRGSQRENEPILTELTTAENSFQSPIVCPQPLEEQRWATWGFLGRLTKE